MKIAIKQLQQNSQILFPQTAAEAVLVKKGSNITTLDKALQVKLESVETPVDSGLTSKQEGQNVVLEHSNPIINPNETPEPKLIKYNNRGHIVETSPVKSLKVSVNKQQILEADGSKENNLLFGDDFKVDNAEIQLQWNNIT